MEKRTVQYKRRYKKGLCAWCSNKRSRGKSLCSKCLRKKRIEYKNNPDKRANWDLKLRCGITLKDKKKMYARQKGICALCHKPLNKDFRKSHVDHSHVTNKVRELLHQRCNIIVGYIESDLYEFANIYVKKHSSNADTKKNRNAGAGFGEAISTIHS